MADLDDEKDYVDRKDYVKHRQNRKPGEPYFPEGTIRTRSLMNTTLQTGSSDYSILANRWSPSKGIRWIRNIVSQRLS